VVRFRWLSIRYAGRGGTVEQLRNVTVTLSTRPMPVW
jgi:hypothetical protein